MNTAILHYPSYHQRGQLKRASLESNSSYLSRYLQKNGIQLGDKMFLRPLWGGKREVSLNRTHYKIFFSSEKEKRLPTNMLFIEHQQYSSPLEVLELTLLNKKNFCLRSLTDGPFKLNGNYVFYALIEVGDRIVFDGVEISFQGKTSLVDEEASYSETFLKKYESFWPSSLGIVIEGETGVGKGYFAKKIHQRSRRYGSFVHLNISSLTPSLVEAELFGHVKGSFTGAICNKQGALEMAVGGTLFLDEIDSLSLDLQVKLLLFLESKSWRAVGSTKEQKGDIRFIFASGSSLKELVKKGKMRSDLYYRITSGLSLMIPPLRHHPDRLREVCLQFAHEKNQVIDEDLIKTYQKLSWPGNIRQLMAHLEKKIMMNSHKKITFDSLDDLFFESVEPIKEVTLKEFKTLKQLKKDYVEKVLLHFKGDESICAKSLGISIPTVRRISSNE